MSVNKVILVGHLGKDPELRYTPSGDAVATFTLATSERFKGRDGQQQEKTEWHNIVAWRQLAEICGKFLHKGKQVYIEGKIQSRSYDDRDGNKRYITEIIADQMQMLGNKGESEGRGDYQQKRSGAEATSASSTRPSQQYEEEPPFNSDDEIPF